MKIGLLIGLLLSAVLAASCAVQQSTSPPTEIITPPTIEVETSTAPAAPTAQVYQVAIDNGNLLPVDVEINTGDTIEWVNKDTVRYTLLFSGFEERLPAGGTFEYRYSEPGTFQYTAKVVEEDQADDEERELRGMVIVN